MLTAMDHNWSKLPHASYPEVLGGKVKSAFKAERKSASKSGDKDLMNEIDQACRSIAELQKIITKANSTRVVADYEPEEKVDFAAVDRFRFVASMLPKRMVGQLRDCQTETKGDTSIDHIMMNKA
jgi:hypothetical protein